MNSLTIRTNAASANILAERAQSMLEVEEMCKNQVAWYQTDTVAEYRKLRTEGIGFPKPAHFAEARTVMIPARDGHLIELRIIQAKPLTKGLLLHFHAGGFVIGSCKSYDNYLFHLSDKLDLSAVSVEYRLAPEHLYPTAHNDAIDATKYVISPEGISELGGPLKVLAGESAGGYLATWVAMELRRDKTNTMAQIPTLIASYPIYDLTFTPSCLSHKREAVLSRDGMKRFVDTAFHNVPVEQRRDPGLSLLYADLADLPPALFLCGTEDPLVDDSVFMATRWSLAGNKAELCLVPGAWHAFTLIPAGEVTDEGLAEIVKFVKRHA